MDCKSQSCVQALQALCCMARITTSTGTPFCLQATHSVGSRAANGVLTRLISPFRPHDTLAECCSSCFHEFLCLPFSASRTTVLLHGQVENGASSDVRELLVVCSKAVNYAKSKSCQALADLEPGTSSAVDSTGEMLPWTPLTLPHHKSRSKRVHHSSRQ